jgi:hypothetical protein
VERVLDVALHHQQSQFIAKSFEPNNGDSPDDGVTLDRRMADLLGRTRTGSINALGSLEKFLASPGENQLEISLLLKRISEVDEH